MRSSARLHSTILRINNGLFASSPHNNVFPKPIKSFEVNSPPEKSSFWAITGPHKSTFLKIVSGQFIPDPPLSRVFPSVANAFDNHGIHFLNFTESSGLDKVHLSARYESFSYKGVLEMTDDVNSVKNYIIGANNYNKNDAVQVCSEYVDKLVDFFNLAHLQDKWISSLSNGQMRRARIVKSLIDQPKLLVVDDPFLGLDPEATQKVSDSLGRVAKEFNISIVLGLRVKDKEPSWVTNIGYVDADGLKVATEVDSEEGRRILSQGREITRTRTLEPISVEELVRASLPQLPHIQFSNASVVYKGVPVLKDFNWAVPRGSKWRILGNNGTGKTTILSLITADHPQSWKSVLTIDGVLRKSGSGSNFFDINNKIGISSPELHALVPRKTMLEVIMTGLVQDVGNSNFMFVAKEDRLTPFARQLLDVFKDRLKKHSGTSFNELLITDQKLALFLRATLKQPEILILDEAFSCMDSDDVMDRCHKLVASWKKTTVLAIGHIDWELPACDYVIKLRGGGKPYDIEAYI